ncbi:SCO2583/SCO2584 N-terminal domain-containing protein [Actinomadura hibisca]|uniref:SCO2583/SCO2584 N-terminal domain-containing protein n=1 Tax=Actinomadura hibisca TaxID=68565 RepID=UPI000832C101|nr:hypothetical protein [Actinomadura hibisca]
MTDGRPEPVFDEDFVRGATITEPSARERARRPGPVERRRARRAERGRRAAAAAAYRDPSGRAAVVKVLAGVLVLLAISTALWWWTRPRVQEAPVKLGAPTPNDSRSAEPRADAPFAGSPAEDYADGAAGIATLAPIAANGLDKGDTARAYERVKQLLIASNLDPEVVFEGRTGKLDKLVDPLQRAEMRRDLKSRGERARVWRTTFAPGSATRVGAVVKVHGTATAAPHRRDGRSGVLVKTDHNFVYAVRPPDDTAEVMRVVVRRTDDFFLSGEGGRTVIWKARGGDSPAPVRCDIEDGLLHPIFRRDEAGAVPTGEPVDPYDLSRPLVGDGSCHQVSRT